MVTATTIIAILNTLLTGFHGFARKLIVNLEDSIININ